eukprot:3719293-Karenia_brevis.AAC.1
MQMIASVLHIPFGSLGYNSMLHLSDLGGSTLRSVLATSGAAKVRLATSLFPLINALHQKLLRAADSLVIGVRDGFDYSPGFSGFGHIDDFSRICRDIFEAGGVDYP